MKQTAPEEIATRLGSGLLSFPVTHFHDDLSFDEDGYRRHIARLGGYGVAGLFAAGGTGEFFSLTPDEVGRVVRAAVAEAPGGLPVIAPAGYGTAAAARMAREAEEAGADGVLLFPPYLTEASQDGLVAHVRAVCAATRLGVTVYSRANAVLVFGRHRLAYSPANGVFASDTAGAATYRVCVSVSKPRLWQTWCLSTNWIPARFPPFSINAISD